MSKHISLTCMDCQKKHDYIIGAGRMSTPNDVLARLPKEDAAKLIEILNSMMKSKTIPQRTPFMMNHADGLSLIDYSHCGESIHLFSTADINGINAVFTPEQLKFIEASINKFNDASKFEGIMAFDAITYCRKCKRLQQGLFIKLRAIVNGKEQAFVYVFKCENCGGNTVLVNDDNVGYLSEGKIVRSPCPDCGGKMQVTSVSYTPE